MTGHAGAVAAAAVDLLAIIDEEVAAANDGPGLLDLSRSAHRLGRNPATAPATRDDLRRAARLAYATAVRIGPR